MTLDDDLAAARAATAELLTHLDMLSADELAGPSLLPGWTRAHVVAHLAGNALSHVRMLEGARLGELRAQYPQGPAGRAEDIERLAADPVAAVDACRSAFAELNTCWTACSEPDWERPVQPGGRDPRPAARLVWARWREVEVHRVDLAAGYGPGDWPEPFARRLLGSLLVRDDLPPMTLDAGRGPLPVSGGGVSVVGTPAALAAWLSGRSKGADLGIDGVLPTLPAWG